MSMLKKLQDVFDINESTLSGCVDIVVTEQPDGSLKSSSFHVTFGKLKVLKSNEKVVTIRINDQEQKVHMKMDSSGKAYFEEIRDESQLERLINYGMSSDDGFSDYDLTNMQSDDEGADRINEEIRRSGFKFDDMVSPTREGTSKSDKQGNSATTAATTATAEKQQQQPDAKEEKKGFNWFNLFGGKKKEVSSSSSLTKEPQQPQKSRSAFASRKNSETISIDEINKLVEPGSAVSQLLPPVPIDTHHSSPSHQEFDANTEQLLQSSSPTAKKILPRITSPQKQNSQQENEEKPTSSNNGAAILPTETIPLKKETLMRDLIDTKKDLKDLIASAVPRAAGSGDQAQIGSANNLSPDFGVLQSKTVNAEEEDDGDEEEEEEEEEDEDEIGLSLCNNIQHKKGQQEKSLEVLFQENKVTFEQFSQDPLKILNDKNLLLKIGYHLYPWEIAASILVSRLAFKQELPESVMQNLIKQQKKKQSSGFLDFLFRRNKNTEQDESTSKPAAASAAAQPTKKPVDSAAAQTTNPISTNNSSSNILPVTSIPASGEQADKQQQNHNSSSSSNSVQQQSTVNQSTKGNLTITSPEQLSHGILSPIGSPKQSDILSTTASTTQQSTSQSQSHHHHQQQQQQLNSQQSSELTAGLLPQFTGIPPRKMSDELSIVSESNSQAGGSSSQRIKKVFRPKSDMLKTFNLQPGANKISFSVNSTLLGEQTLEGYIFLWRPNTQIVISDIDGTITKSDMLGQIMPLLDKDWTHEGVIELLSNVQKNGYQILYLTARAIGQSEQTRKFIYNVKQGNLNLPLGPVVMSSDRLLKSFKREVIDRKPEVFKISVLREIQALFPTQKTPYFAGFGNRETDCISYRAVKVAIQNIYITNPAGELHQINTTEKTSYIKLNEMINNIFPCLNDIESAGVQQSMLVSEQNNALPRSINQHSSEEEQQENGGVHVPVAIEASGVVIQSEESETNNCVTQPVEVVVVVMGDEQSTATIASQAHNEQAEITEDQSLQNA